METGSIYRPWFTSKLAMEAISGRQPLKEIAGDPPIALEPRNLAKEAVSEGRQRSFHAKEEVKCNEDTS